MATLILVWGIRRRSRRRRQCRGTWYHLDTHEHHSGYTPRSTAIVEAPRNRRGRGASRLALGCHGCRADPSVAITSTRNVGDNPIRRQEIGLGWSRRALCIVSLSAYNYQHPAIQRRTARMTLDLIRAPPGTMT